METPPAARQADPAGAFKRRRTILLFAVLVTAFPVRDLARAVLRQPGVARYWTIPLQLAIFAGLFLWRLRWPGPHCAARLGVASYLRCATCRQLLEVPRPG